MGMCPLCNGFEKYEQSCSSCGDLLVDAGKVTDFLDDYSAYMEIELLKMVDGNVSSLDDNICMHVISCPTCDSEQMIAVKE
ncbi:hypothetical protein [Sutcliffiella halmapala]|uniref:hypothetical protein n=1 Tax=Sutcliffiella halmapala TaxID=79882 RepID=UPI0009958FAE|nr:hypothetical protein [Sutcliffiella halmapala]